MTSLEVLVLLFLGTVTQAVSHPLNQASYQFYIQSASAGTYQSRQNVHYGSHFVLNSTIRRCSETEIGDDTGTPYSSLCRPRCLIRLIHIYVSPMTDSPLYILEGAVAACAHCGPRYVHELPRPMFSRLLS